MIKRETIQELKDKLDAVFQAYVRTEEKLREEIGEISWGEIPESDASKAYYYLEYMLANITRQSFLIMACSWLEMAMDVIGEAYIPDYMNKVKYTASGKKRGGSWFGNRVVVFRKVFDAFKGKTKDEQRQFIENVRKVRNCIVHAGGRVEKDKYPDQVDKAVEWIWEKAKEGNYMYAEIVDELIYLREDILAEVVIVSEDIIDHLWEQAEIWEQAENESR